MSVLARAPLHGTNAGYQKHHDTGIPACMPCVMAHRRTLKASRDRGRCARGLGWPLLAVRERPTRAGKTAPKIPGGPRPRE